MTEYEKLALCERICAEVNVEIFAQIRRRDCMRNPDPCGIAAICNDGSVRLYLEEHPEVDGETISAEEFEATYKVVCLSFE